MRELADVTVELIEIIRQIIQHKEDHYKICIEPEFDVCVENELEYSLKHYILSGNPKPGNIKRLLIFTKRDNSRTGIPDFQVVDDVPLLEKALTALRQYVLDNT